MESIFQVANISDAVGSCCYAKQDLLSADAIELASLEQVWRNASGQTRLPHFCRACPGRYMLIAFDGTWQEAKEIAKVAIQILVVLYESARDWM